MYISARARLLRKITQPLVLLPFVLIALAQTTVLPVPDAKPSFRAATQSRSPIDYFRRADKLTNIRLPGSAPFYMRVTFQAYPGMDFADPGHSTMLTGQGVYEETWVSPEKWRREVILGGYHALEIHAEGKRTFQASSSYEPTRVMMLLSALLAPVPRFVLEPELDAHPPHWKLEHRISGTIPWVRIQDRGQSPDSVDATVYDFLSSGILVRREAGILTSWDDDQSFAGRIVPRHVTVQGTGLESPMISAIVSIRPLQPSDHTIVQAAGEAAGRGSTLEPIGFETMDNSGARAIHIQALPPLPDRYPAGVEISATSVVDKNGMPQDAEIIAIRDEGPPLNHSAKEVLWEISRQMVSALLKDRYRPALIDGKPCQVYSGEIMGSPQIH